MYVCMYLSRISIYLPRPTSAAAGGAFALARLTAQVGGAIAAHIEQPSERTIARSAGKKWNAATRSFV